MPVEIAVEEVLELLSALVDKSLVVYEEDANGNGRYRLLETVRQYGREKLEADEETKDLRNRHRDWYLAFAEQAEPALTGPEQGIWLERLEVEHDNLRLALAWSIETEKREQGTGKRKEEAKQEQREDAPSFPFSLPSFPLLEVGLRLCGALQRFWWVRGHLGEGRAWCAAALEAEEASGRTAARAKALNGAGSLAASLGDYASAQTYFQEGLAIRREMGDKQGIANSLSNLGIVAWSQGDLVSARTYHQEGLVIKQEIGDKLGIAGSLSGLGILATAQGDYTSAQTYYAESLALRQEAGDKLGIAASLYNLGCVTFDQGDYPSARTYFQESLSIRQEIGDKQGIANSLSNLGHVALTLGDLTSARPYYQESLFILQEIGERRGIVNTLDGFASLAATQALAATAPEDTAEAARKAGAEQTDFYLRQAARLWAAAQALREEIGIALSPQERQQQEAEIAALQARLGEADWTAAWNEGHALTLEQAIDYALSNT